MSKPARPSTPEEILEELRPWLESLPTRPDAALLADILKTAMRLDTDGTHRMDLKMINATLKELRYAAKVFEPYRHVRKVTIFGSARTAPHEPEYVQARRFAHRIVERGFMVITGAGGGIMEAGHVGAGTENSFGVNIHLPFEQTANHVIENDPKLVNFKYFFTRKVAFIKETSAVVLFPGGFGTLDEGFETLTLLQTGKTTPIPVVLMDAEGGSYWKDWKEYVIRNVLSRGNISPEDLYLFTITDDIDEAVSQIVGFYRNYHSCRYVGGILHVRLQYRPDDRTLELANEKFNDLLVRGRIERADLLPVEKQDPALARLASIRFHFNRRNHGRLHKLIELLNTRAPAEPRPADRPRIDPRSSDPRHADPTRVDSRHNGGLSASDSE